MCIHMYAYEYLCIIIQTYMYICMVCVNIRISPYFEKGSMLKDKNKIFAMMPNSFAIVNIRISNGSYTS